jgi:glycosyltransferase involved in cell wall biosynthesis
MKVCLICVEIFAWGKYGGFGRATRMIGRELAKRGIEVTAIVPRRAGQGAVERLDGMTVLSYPFGNPLRMLPLLRNCAADVYHSQHPSLGTWLAQRARPGSKHLVTFRDPKLLEDWLIEFRRPSRSRLRVLMNWLYEDMLFVRSAVRRADGRNCAAAFLNDKLRRKYGFDVDLDTLPTPVVVPPPCEKAATPTVCYVGRWDQRKRPERFFELATKFPEVKFIAVGRAQDADWEASLRRRYRDVANLELAGFVDQFDSGRLSEILGRSWILVNTAAREGLPSSMLEALAHRCAILSEVNPDDVASRFGYHAAAGDFERGLASLLEAGAWRALGEAGHDYVRRHHELGAVIDKHVAVYEGLLRRSRSGSATSLEPGLP